MDIADTRNDSKLKNYNVAGSSNGILLSFNRETISVFPKFIYINDTLDGLTVEFDYEDKKSKEVSLVTMDIPCPRALKLSCQDADKHYIDCVFSIVNKKSKVIAKLYILDNVFHSF